MPDALHLVAESARSPSAIIVQGSRDAGTLESRRAEIAVVADEIDALAKRAERESVTYDQFNSLAERLKQRGFFPDSAIASTIGWLSARSTAKKISSY